jgi:outer membrane immunogenic protein
MRAKLLIQAVALAIMTATGAQAADLAERYEIAAPKITGHAYNWTGVYAGVHGGYSWGSDRTAEFFTATGAFTGLFWNYSADTMLAGAHAGYLHQFGSVVLGVEGEAEFSDATGGFVDPTNLAIGNPGGSGVLRNKWRASVRGKLGYAAGRWMPFVTGGVAFAHLKYTYGNPFVVQKEITQGVRTGYTVGLGVSYAITDRLRWTTELRYTDFGYFRYASVIAFPGLLTGRQQPRFTTLRTGLSFRF